MTRRYTVTIKVERDAGRRLDAGAHRAVVEAAIARALAGKGWSVASTRISSRHLQPPPLEIVPAPEPKPFDPLHRIDARFPQAEREWMRRVLEAEGMALWTIDVQNRGNRGWCHSAQKRISIGKGWLTRPAGLEYTLVDAWLRKRGAAPCQAGGLRYSFIHEVAHGLDHKRVRARKKAAWRAGRVPKSRGGSHGTSFRRALLGLLQRHLPVVFEDEPVAIAAASP